MSKNKPTHKTEARSDLRFAIVASRYNEKYVDRLIERVRARLREKKIPASAVTLTRVPGANEIPYVASMLALTGDCDCVIALGVVIAGDTPHHEIIAHATANELQHIAVDTQVPVINGIVVTLNEAQADERVFGEQDRGSEFAESAVEMAMLGNRLADYLEQLDRNDMERERNEEIFGNFSLDDDDDDDGDDFFGSSDNPYHKN